MNIFLEDSIMKHNFEISYTQQGDYLLPDLRLPEQPKVEIGIWGKRHLRYMVRGAFHIIMNFIFKGEHTLNIHIPRTGYKVFSIGIFTG